MFQLFALGNFYLAFFFLCNSAVSDPANDPFGGKGPEVISVVRSSPANLCLSWVLTPETGQLHLHRLDRYHHRRFARKQAARIEVGLHRSAFSTLALLLLADSRLRFPFAGVMVGLAAIFGIALYCTGWTIYLSVPKTLDGWRNIRALLRQSGFRDIVISLGATYFLYILSSVSHFPLFILCDSLTSRAADRFSTLTRGISSRPSCNICLCFRHLLRFCRFFRFRTYKTSVSPALSLSLSLQSRC